MEDRKTKSREKTALRRRAEKQLQGQKEALADLTPEKIRRLVHELRVHQVELEIQNEELRETQVNLEESRSRYGDLYNFAPVSYFTLDETGRILEANLTAASLLGVERGNLVGKKFLQFVAREDMGVFNRFLPQVLENRSRQSCEVSLKGRFGELVARLDGILWKDTGGQTHCRVTATDISNLRAVERELRDHRDRLEQMVQERTASLKAQTLKLEVQREELLRVTDELERERARLTTTLEQMPEGIVIAEAHSGKLLLVNRKMSTIFGRSLSPEDGLEFLSQFQASHPDGRPLQSDEFPLPRALATGQVVAGEEIEVLGGNDIRRTLWVNAAPVRDRLGRIIAAVATYQDITERKQAEADLEESRSQSAFLADLLESSAQPFGVGFLDGRLGLFNAAFPQLLGYSREEFGALNWATDITPPEWRDHEAAQLEELERTGRPVRYEKEYWRKDGTLVSVELLVHLRRDEQDRPSYYYSFINDITARKAAEAEIRRLASFPRLNVNPVLEVDFTGAITFCNQAALTALQGGGGAAEPEAFLPEDLENILSPATEQQEAAFYREVRVKDAVYAENIAYVEPFKVIRIYATDITARKRFEEALRTANAQLSAIIENSPLAIMQLDEEGTILSCNPSAEGMLGWSAAEMVGQRLPMVPPDEREIVGEVLRRAGQGERFTGIERRRLRKDGSLVDVSVSVAPMYDETGTFTGIVSLMEDITPRKEAEEKLREREAKYRAVIETSVDGFCIADMEGRFLEFNDAFVDLLGYSREELLTMSIPDIEAQKTPAEVTAAIEKVRLEGHVIFETRLRSKDGRIWPAEPNISYWPIAGGRMFFFVRNITERKRDEEALRESREDLNRAQAVAQTGSWRMNVQKNELTWSDENHRIFGVPGGTAMTYETFLGTVHPEDRGMADRKWMAALKGEPYDIEHRIIVDGTVKWLRERAELEFGSEGQLLGGFGTTQDITERKAAEEALRRAHDELEQRVRERTTDLRRTVEQLQLEMEERRTAEELLRQSEARFRTAFEQSPVGAVIVDHNLGIQRVNQALCQIIGYSAEELASMNVADVCHPDDQHLNLEYEPAFSPVI